MYKRQSRPRADIDDHGVRSTAKQLEKVTRDHHRAGHVHLEDGIELGGSEVERPAPGCIGTEAAGVGSSAVDEHVDAVGRVGHLRSRGAVSRWRAN